MLAATSVCCGCAPATAEQHISDQRRAFATRIGDGARTNAVDRAWIVATAPLRSAARAL